MRVNDDYDIWNAEKELADPDSVLQFWKALLAVRKRYELFVSAPSIVPAATPNAFNDSRSMATSHSCLRLMNSSSPTPGAWETSPRLC